MIKKIFDIFNIVFVSTILFLLFYYIFNNYIFESGIYFKSTFYGGNSANDSSVQQQRVNGLKSTIPGRAGYYMFIKDKLE